MEYHWHRPPERSQHVVRLPSERTQSTRLFVACTQTSLPPQKQKALVSEWCKLLPTLEDITELSLLSKVPQRLFDAACRMPSLADLYVKWSGIDNIEALSEARALRYLRIGSSTGLVSSEPLKNLPKLRWLGLENLKCISDVEPLGHLTELEGLALDGSTWSTWKVNTLAPLASLTMLKYLSLANLRTADRTLTPLFGLRNLQTFHAATWWDTGELAELRRGNQGLMA